MGTKPRNVYVSFIKLFFAYEVALAHFNKAFVGLIGMYCVDLFFVISGYYLASSFQSGKYSSTLNYSLHRLRRLYPQYFLCFALLFIFECIQTENLTLSGIINKLIKSLPEMLLIQNIGWFDGGINFPLWFLCVLLLASHILFALLRENKNLTVNVICPILSICFGAYYANVYEDHEVSMWGVANSFFYIPFWRCMAFLSVGILLYYLLKHIVRQYGVIIETRKTKIVLTAFCLWNYFLFFWAKNSFLSYIPFVLAISICLIYPGWQKLVPASKMADALSLSVFLNQALAIQVVCKISKDFSIGDLKSTVLYLLVLTVISILTHLFTSMYNRNLLRNQRT